MAGDLCYEADLDALGLKCGYERVPCTVRRYGRKSQSLKRRLPKAPAEIPVKEGAAATGAREWPSLPIAKPWEDSMKLPVAARTGYPPFKKQTPQ
jgi:hypothetical protein